MKYLIGIGTYTMGDDSVGLRVAETVVARSLDSGFEVVDISHDSLQLLSYFAPETEKILIVDCVSFGVSPGETAIFSPDEVETQKTLGHLTTHEGDAIKIIELGKQLGYVVPPIKIFGIQPKSTSQGMALSEVLQERFEEYVSIAIRTIAEDWMSLSPLK